MRGHLFWSSDLFLISECRHIINAQGEHGGKEALAARCSRMKGCRLTYVYHCRAHTFCPFDIQNTCLHAMPNCALVALLCEVSDVLRNFHTAQVPDWKLYK